MKFNDDISSKLADSPDWLRLCPFDNRRWLLDSHESFTVYNTLVNLLDIPKTDLLVQKTKQEMVQDPQVEKILATLPKWRNIKVSGHNDPKYIPNLLLLLQSWGFTVEDDVRIKNMLNEMLEHVDSSTGQFLWYNEIYDRKTKEKRWAWDSLLCDHHLITSLMLLYGYGKKKEIKMAIKRIEDLIDETENGVGWKCLPGLKSKFRGPGRKNEICPMLIVDILRGFHMIQKEEQLKQLIPIGQSLLNVWLNRAQIKPYMFGHGRKFRTLQPPFFWYNIGSVLDALSYYPSLVDSTAYRELLSVGRLAFDNGGNITPNSIKMFFKSYSFGQKKQPSPWTTYYLTAIIKRSVNFCPNIIDDVLSLDGNQFKGSKK